MKVVVKKRFIGFDREFMPGETVDDLPEEKIEKLNNSGLGILLEPIVVEGDEDANGDTEKKSKKR